MDPVTISPVPQKQSSFLPALLVLLVLLLGSSTAFLGYQNMQLKNQIASQTQIPAPSYPTPTPDQMANWKMYTNNAGYSIKYPPSLKTEVIAAGGQGEATEVTRSFFVFQAGSSNRYEERYINFEVTQLEPSYNQGTITQVRINGYPAKKIVLSNAPFDIYSVKTYRGEFIEIYVSNNPTRNQLANQILSTFTLLENKPTTTAQTTTLSYALPTGWKTVQDKTNTFEVGYDPQIEYIYSQESISDLNVGLTKVGQFGGQSFFVVIKPYDGGSRHTFILGPGGIQEQEKLPGYHEVNYTYNGRSCLVLYGLAISQFPSTQGMCAIDGTRAFNFGMWRDQTDAEKLISTIRLLK